MNCLLVPRIELKTEEKTKKMALKNFWSVWNYVNQCFYAHGYFKKVYGIEDVRGLPGRLLRF